MTRQFWLAVAAYILPTFPLGYFWHLVVFKSTYDALQVYRADIVIPFGILSMIVQGCIWAYLYSRLFAAETVLAGAARFMGLAAPLAWSFLVIAVSAKHQMASVSGYVLIETAFIVVHYLIVSPLIALAYATQPAPARKTADA